MPFLSCSLLWGVYRGEAPLLHLMIIELSIFIILMLLLHTGRQQVIHEDVELGVGTLAANTAKKASSTAIKSSNENGFKISKMKYAAHWDGRTDGEGPVLFGISIGLTDAEITEAILAKPTHRMDEPDTERANRRVFPLEWWPIDGVESRAQNMNPLRSVRIPWKEIPENVNLDWWVISDSALTSGMVVDIRGVYVGEWMRD